MNDDRVCAAHKFFEEAISEIKSNSLLLLQALYGRAGEINGQGRGMVSRVVDLGGDISKLSQKVDEHILTHIEQDKKVALRRWDFAKIIIAQVCTMIMTLAVAYWGLKK
jgi:hypothetical protein